MRRAPTAAACRREGHIPATQDNVGAVGLHLYAILHLIDRHLGELLDLLNQQTIMVRIEILHDDKRHGAFWVRGQRGKEGFDGGQAARGSADADDRKTRPRRRTQVRVLQPAG